MLGKQRVKYILGLFLVKHDLDIFSPLPQYLAVKAHEHHITSYSACIQVNCPSQP